MIDFCKWVESKGLYYSFHKIEDIAAFAEDRINISWAFLRHLVINTTHLNKVNPKIIELKGAYLNIGFPFKSISKKVLYVENESIYFDIATLPVEELEKIMRQRIFNQNIGFIMANKSDFSAKIEVLEKTILDYYSNKNLEAIRDTFFKTMVSDGCLLPIIATNLYEEKVLILVSHQRLDNSITITPYDYDRVQVPFLLKTSDLSYFYKW